jgi:hypothetical protein
VSDLSTPLRIHSGAEPSASGLVPPLEICILHQRKISLLQTHPVRVVLIRHAKAAVRSPTGENLSKLARPLVGDAHSALCEELDLMEMLGMGFMVMGAIGYVVKLSMCRPWPPTRAGSETWGRIFSEQPANYIPVHIPVNNILVGGA